MVWRLVFAQESRHMFSELSVMSACSCDRWRQGNEVISHPHQLLPHSSSSLSHVVRNSRVRTRRSPLRAGEQHTSELAEDARLATSSPVHQSRKVSRASNFANRTELQVGRGKKERSSSARQFHSIPFNQLNSTQIPSQWPPFTTTTLTTSSGRLSVRV